MLDLLPIELWRDKNSKFLDPVSKSGVFLREITKRLMNGLSQEIPDVQTRLDHIFAHQVYGIAITELTSLLSRRTVYCSKKANHAKYALSEIFDDEQGNIKYDPSIGHAWQGDKCDYCGANKAEYDREPGLESHAYAFIHTDNPLEIFNTPNMKFDVIIGNPPYQLGDGGHGKSAAPLYHKFIEQAKKLKPRYLSMIIPARWYAGGKWLDEFRKEMLNDARIRKLVDFENSSEVFPGVDIAGGICYFLWNRDQPWICEMTNFYDWKPITLERDLTEFSILIRHAKALPIIRRVRDIQENEGKFLSERVSPSRPFGMRTFYEPQKTGVPCWFIQKIGLSFANSADVTDEGNLLNKWKLLIPKAPIAGQTDFSKPVWFYTENNTRIASPGECCTESYIVACATESEEEILSFRSYLFTKVVRFLLLQTVISQDVTRKNFCFIPDLGIYSCEYTDELLRARWGITDEEWEFIDNRIR
jgi:site-specific DNA-methyltransferase (adenine-specific)